MLKKIPVDAKFPNELEYKCVKIHEIRIVNNTTTRQTGTALKMDDTNVFAEAISKQSNKSNQSLDKKIRKVSEKQAITQVDYNPVHVFQQGN